VDRFCHDKPPALVCSCLDRFYIPTNCGEAINQTTLNTIQLYEQFATISYCSANFAGQIGDKVTCPGGTCPLVEQSNVTIVDRLAR
jgi:hypothetical protein